MSVESCGAQRRTRGLQPADLVGRLDGGSRCTRRPPALAKEALSLLLEAHPAAAAAADADGKYFRAPRRPAPDDAATLLFKASGKPASAVETLLPLSRPSSGLWR